MNKANLKEKWGQYCDTDELVDTMMALLTKYHHRNSEHGVCKLLDKYFTNKQSLIELFKKSSNYIGKMRIAFDIELAREIDVNAVYHFCNRFGRDVNADSAILKTVDSDGKCLTDYLKTGIKSLSVQDLSDANITGKLKENNAKRSLFSKDGFLVETVTAKNNFYNAMDNFAYVKTATLDSSRCGNIQARVDYKLAPGMKTSRAFNRVCAHYGVDKLPKYNKLFAEYADLVSDGKRKLKFFISLNPLDYLTMSFGNSWASCHTIDKNNERRMPNAYSGGYCAGTLSYMLDKTSMVTYVHSKMPESIEEGKLYRNMFHFENDVLIQGRIYPQSNDGATDLYQVFRQFVQKEFAEMLGLEKNAWVKRNKAASCNTVSTGLHYQDYVHFGACNASYPKERESSLYNEVHIGHVKICPYCGEEYETGAGWLAHSACVIPSTATNVDIHNERVYAYVAV